MTVVTPKLEICARLRELAERCEKATRPDRELDEAIALALGRRPDFAADWGARGHERTTYEQFTVSLDAAMTLIPDDADASGERFKVEGWNDNGVYPDHVKASAWVAGAQRVYAATPALALCAAALRARSATARQAGSEPPLSPYPETASGDE
jgi:hypothetical protein